MCNFIYGPVIFLIKLSLFLLLNNIFGRIHWFRRLALMGIIFTLLLYSTTTVAYIALCIQPGDGGYRELTRTPRCQKTGNIDIVQGVIDVFTDLFLVALPIWPIVRLRLRLRRKLEILALFSLGLWCVSQDLTCVAVC